MGRLIDLLSPTQSSDMQTVVSELIKGIISMASPAPGAGLTEGLQNGPASNRFARELAHRNSVSKLVDYILADFGPDLEEAFTTTPDASMTEEASTPKIGPRLPNSQSSASSVVHSISIIIELIRKNNSDYFEPYLFHTLRNRLIQVQQHLQAHTEDGRETLEKAMKEMVDRMGVVHLGSVLEIMCERLDAFQKYLREPRSMVSMLYISPSVSRIDNLTSKGRFRPRLVLSPHSLLNDTASASFTQSFCIARICQF
jgi:serine/threonine-protein phosphatase 6 regulatory subunit 3